MSAKLLIMFLHEKTNLRLQKFYAKKVSPNKRKNPFIAYLNLNFLNTPRAIIETITRVFLSLFFLSSVFRKTDCLRCSWSYKPTDRYFCTHRIRRPTFWQQRPLFLFFSLFASV